MSKAVKGSLATDRHAEAGLTAVALGRRARPPGARAAPSRVHTSSVPLPVLVWCVLCLIWSSTWLFIKLGLADLPPVSFAGIRFVVAASVLWGIVAIRRTPLPKGARAWGFLALTGFLAFSLNYGLLFWGEAAHLVRPRGRASGHDSGVRPRPRAPSPALGPHDASEGARRVAGNRGRGGHLLGPHDARGPGRAARRHRHRRRGLRRRALERPREIARRAPSTP